MKHLKILTVFVIFVAMLFSCKQDAKQSIAELATEDFFTVMAAEKTVAVNAMYPNFNDINDPYFPDRIEIKKSINITPTLVRVDVNGYVTDSSVTEERDLVIYVATDSLGNFSHIENSLGFCRAEQHELCVLAENIGAITDADSTDFMVQDKFVEVEEIYNGLYEVSLTRYKGIDIENFSWKRLETGAKGYVVVQNNSKYNVDNLKYCIEALDGNGNIISCDTSLVNIAGTVESGAIVIDKFAMAYNGKAKSLVATLLYDAEELAKEDVLSAEYDGNEYYEYYDAIYDADAEKEAADRVEYLNL